MLKVLNSIVLLGKSCEYLNDNKSVPKSDEKQPKSEPTSPKRSKSKEDLPTYASNMEGEPENLSHLEIKRSHSLVIDRPPMMKMSGEDIKPKSPNTPGRIIAQPLIIIMMKSHNHFVLLNIRDGSAAVC